MANTQTGRETTRYVLVVHGIGEQRKNETVLPVINRFAEARRTEKLDRKPANPLSLGILSTYLDLGEWIELDGIPCEPCDGSKLPPFIGRRLHEPKGENLRFIDIHWAHVMKEQFETVGEGLDPWSSSLLERLTSRQAPDWILQFIRSLRKGLIPLQKVLGLRLPGLSDKIFNRFLGDVQLYGEFGPTRGRGVRVFHEVLAKIQDHHDRNPELGTARFTVIAHSLGSVLAFDALLYAHGARKPDSLELDAHRCGLSGYRSARAGALPRLDWIENVDAFVTLGSPIDKYLILWWLSYKHLLDTDWMDPDVVEMRRANPIRHYNYCDEQDPVGHELDVAYTAPAVSAVFTKEEERVFTRYSAPGVAHVKYWSDGQLFARILDLAVDGKPKDEEWTPPWQHAFSKVKAGTKKEQQSEVEPTPARRVNWFRWKTYVVALVWAYLGVPVLGWMAATASMIWAMNPDLTWGARLPLVGISLGALALTLWLMTLLVPWRVLLRSKRRQSAAELPPVERYQRNIATWTVRGLILTLPLVWLYCLVASVMAARPDWARDVLGLDSFAAFLRGIPDWLKTEDIFGWKPQALRTEDFKPDDFFAGLIVMAALALIIGLWNLVVFVWVKLKWKSIAKTLSVNFVDYQVSDPTRASATAAAHEAPASE